MPDAADRTDATIAQVESPAAVRLAEAEEIAVRGDHLAARRILAAVAADPTMPGAARLAAGVHRRALGPDPLAVLFGVLALVTVLVVWALALPH